MYWRGKPWSNFMILTYMPRHGDVSAHAKERPRGAKKSSIFSKSSGMVLFWEWCLMAPHSVLRGGGGLSEVAILWKPMIEYAHCSVGLSLIVLQWEPLLIQPFWPFWPILWPKTAQNSHKWSFCGHTPPWRLQTGGSVWIKVGSGLGTSRVMCWDHFQVRNGHRGLP